MLSICAHSVCWRMIGGLILAVIGVQMPISGVRGAVSSFQSAAGG